MRRWMLGGALGLVLLVTLGAQAEEGQVIRDQHGRRVRTIEPGVGGRQIIRDERGRRVGSIEPGVGGRQVIRDEHGRRVGTVEKR